MSEATQGQRAIRHGRDNEENIKAMLRRSGFLLVQLKSKYSEAIQELVEQAEAPRLFDDCCGVYATQAVICKGLFGDDVREDFVLYKKGWPGILAITAKHQYKPGSTTDKLEHVYAEVVEFYPCPCIVLLEGPMFTEPMAERGREHGRRSGGKVAAVFTSIGELSRWLTNGAQYPERPLCPKTIF
jgi:hypothetical protein